MVWEANFKRGIDLPTWDTISAIPDRTSFHGTGNAYDGRRYMYWLVQHGSGSSASTTTLWRFDTWTEGWVLLATTQSSWTGADIDYDPIRNVLYLMYGNGSNVIQVYNLNTATVTVAGVACAAYALTSLTVLPIGSNTSASFAYVDDLAVAGDLTVANGAAPIDRSAAIAGSTATTLVVNTELITQQAFGYGHIGLYARFTTGALVGQRRLITAATRNSLTTAAFSAAPAVGDAFVVEVPEATASAATTTTITLTGAGWTANAYANSDVVIVAGTGAGQRRRIASHTVDTLTLAAAYTAPATNPRVGPFTVAPDATSVFRIVPSADFLYYIPANGATGLYRMDVAQTGAAAGWTTLAVAPGTISGGANLMYPQQFDPFGLICLRGNGTKDIYTYDIGTNTWTVLSTFGGETFNTGASAALLHSKRKMVVFVQGSIRSVMYDLTTGVQDAGPMMPYANPSGFDGHRARYVKTADGVEWLYQQRAGGQEFFRVALEWLV